MRLVNLSLATASAAFLSVGSAAAARTPAPGGVGEVPPNLTVPAGNQLAFALEAEGVQIYSCAANGTSVAWALQAPEAKLSEPGGAAAGKHYAGPTWEATDGSTVVGAKVEASTADPAAIPWLLLRAASHAGSGRMADVTFVQRLRTSGGNAPSVGCDTAHLGSVARVPYRALYRFFQKSAGRPSAN